MMEIISGKPVIQNFAGIFLSTIIKTIQECIRVTANQSAGKRLYTRKMMLLISMYLLFPLSFFFGTIICVCVFFGKYVSIRNDHSFVISSSSFQMRLMMIIIYRRMTISRSIENRKTRDPT